jgi:hypothetical protein
MLNPPFFLDEETQKEEAMVQIAACGCTKQGPGETCERGKKLFGAAAQAYQAMIAGTTAIAGEEWWAEYTLAHLAYSDHLLGWCDRDVKVQRGMVAWMVFIRFCGRWVMHFGSQEEDLVREWLQIQGYQQFVGMGKKAKNRLSGYYRKGDAHVVFEGNVPLQIGGIPSGRTEKLAEQPVAASSVDLKAQVTVLVALLVARIPNTPTVVERLFVQRRAAALLRTHGIQVGPPDERVIQELIEEAVQQKERMNGMPMRNTQVLQE